MTYRSLTSPNLINAENIEEVSFESCYYSGSMIGGEQILTPIIYTKDEKKIKDIRVGFQTYTTWAHEKNQFEKGETISECLARHRDKVENIKKIVVFVKDTTEDKTIRVTFLWTQESGWRQVSYKEII